MSRKETREILFCFPANKTLYLECKIFGDSIVYGNIICLSFFDSFSFYLYIFLYCLSFCLSLSFTLSFLPLVFYLSFRAMISEAWRGVLLTLVLRLTQNFPLQILRNAFSFYSQNPIPRFQSSRETKI